MNSKDLNKQFDALKRGAVDLVRDLHARKLAIPAGALLLAIVAALVLLPSGTTPPPAPPTATVPAPAAPAVERVAQVSLIEPATLDDDIPLSSSGDPFIGHDGYDCARVGSSTPATYECLVADLKVRIICTSDTSGGPCAGSDSSGDGATAGAGAAGSPVPAGAPEETGGSGGETGTGDSGSGDSGSSPDDTPPAKSTYYNVSVTLDGKTKKNVEAGDELPNSSSSIVVYAGTNDAHTKGVFLAADGVTVTGVPVDATFGSFSLKKGQSATLTDANGATHKLTLKSISKVTK